MTEESLREDIHSIGFMMVELMEVKTSILHPKSIELKLPEVWENSTGITNFLKATQHDSIASLKTVS